MSNLYYPVSGGAIPSLTNGKTKDKIISEENTFSAVVTFRRLITKVKEYLEENGIPYTKIVISPSLDLLISEKDVREYPIEIGEGSYNQLLKMDDLREYCSLDLSCICCMNGEDEDLLYPEEHDNFGLDLSPKIIKYNVFVNLLEKSDIRGHNLPKTYGAYKKKFIDSELADGLGYNMNTDIIVAEKARKLS